MGYGKSKDATDRANQVNDAARKAIGNSGKTDGNGNLLGTTRAEREGGQAALDRMVAAKEITPRQAKKAKEDALRQAGAKGGFIARKFGR